MIKDKSISTKKVKPLYENKAAIPLVHDGNVRIVVVKAHDGLEEGESYVKDVKIAAQMVKKGYWKYE